MVDAAQVRSALARWCDALEAAAPELNRLDGRLGDGDLGTTLQRCAVLVREALPAMTDELASVFKACAAASAKASGSSFGTLLAVAFLTAAKRVQGRQALDRSSIVALLDEIVGALSARGGAALGDKTMLDSLHAVSRALAECGDGANLRTVAREAASGALDAMRSQPNRIGRARMFADKSVGADDPGMVAVLRMVESL
jgi:phosphoenolpyruvate---glycerone phosphotransferase subunit DhaL